MVRHVNAPDTEPEESNFPIPSEKEHLFQVSDYWQAKDDEDVIVAKCEVVGGDDEGKTLLNRVNLDENYKGFYYTRLFLKAIGEPYKGSIIIDEKNWPGRQFYATVKHDKTGKYANIDTYNFEKKVENVVTKPVKWLTEEKKQEEIAWDD